MIFVILGPTCSGKSELAEYLANKFSCPIVNCDAFQVYKDMDIGTAKISKNDEIYSKYYLLDYVSPEETYSIKRYQDDFKKLYDSVLNKHKNVVMCGGSGLYVKAALYDYTFEDDQDDVSDLEKLDTNQLVSMLAKLDKQALETIHPNNKKRLIRAISIARTHKLNKTESINAQSHSLLYKDVRFICLNPDRNYLYEKINKRVDDMFDKGLIDEVKSLLKKYNLSITAKSAIGYKEVIDYLNNNLSLNECKELIKQRSRNYAKRQVTFFNHQFDNISFYKNSDEVIKELDNE